jgi:chromosomal replication initiator protein
LECWWGVEKIRRGCRVRNFGIRDFLVNFVSPKRETQYAKIDPDSDRNLVTIKVLYDTCALSLQQRRRPVFSPDHSLPRDWSMMKDHTTVWENCLRFIKRNVNPQSFRTWFEPIRPVSLSQNLLTIQVPNSFFYEWLEENYLNLLKKTIRQELGTQGQLEYQILNGTSTDPTGNATAGSRQDARDEATTSLSESSIPGVMNTTQIKNPFVIPGIRRMQVDPQLNPSYTFDSFIEGDCNQLGRSAGLAVAKKPGKTAFNPLVLFGNTGLGKTHLAQAIGNQILRMSDNKTVLYVSAEKFTNQIIHAIKNNAVADFVNFYQLIDVLIVDDIQFLAHKQKTQEIFFHIFNQLHQNGKQIILTSDRPPKDLNGMEDRLISRFKWGLSADLQTPDLETRMAILESKMKEEGVDIPSNVSEFICFHIKNNIRELEGVLVSLVAQATLNQRAIDMDLARDVIKNFVTESSREITTEAIQNLVADHFNVPAEKLAGKTRKRAVVIARQLSMYLTKKMTTHSLKAIGDAFGGRDHSTVIYSCRAVQDLMDTDAIFKEKVEDIEKKIRMSLTTR